MNHKPHYKHPRPRAIITPRTAPVMSETESLLMEHSLLTSQSFAKCAALFRRGEFSVHQASETLQMVLIWCGMLTLTQGDLRAIVDAYRIGFSTSATKQEDEKEDEYQERIAGLVTRTNADLEKIITAAWERTKEQQTDATSEKA